MIISLKTKKTFDEIHHVFIIKILEKLGTQQIHLEILKAVHIKPIASINLDGEKLKVFDEHQELDKAVHPLYLFNMELKVLARALRQLIEIKKIHIEKEEFISMEKGFLNRIPLAQTLRLITINKWDLINLEMLLQGKGECHSDKAASYRIGKVFFFFINSTSDGGLISKMYNILKKLDIK